MAAYTQSSGELTYYRKLKGGWQSLISLSTAGAIGSFRRYLYDTNAFELQSNLAHIYTLFAPIAVAATLPVAAPATGVGTRGDDAIAYNQAYDYYVFAYDDLDVESKKVKKE